MHIAIYRAYRPKFFRDVIGQEKITDTLKNEVATGRIAHSYLFTGSRGTGKTTCAKILSKAINCPDMKDGEPCGVCDICTGIDDGTILDVCEIDAASNSSVEDVRALREEAFYTPVRTKYKVYILDECHRLSPNAFDALLKIMEEPPEHIVFILATTEVHKVLPTILSRCQRFDFMRVSPATIGRRIEQIAQMEGFSITADGAEMLGRLGEGAVRDSLSILDKCLSVSNDLTVEVIQKITGITDDKNLLELIAAVSYGDFETMLALTKRFYDESKDFAVLCSQLIGLYRDLMYSKLKVPNAQSATVGIERSEIDALASKLTNEGILMAMKQLCKCRDEMGRVIDARTQLEITLSELTMVSLMPTENAVAKVQKSVPVKHEAVKHIDKEKKRPDVDEITPHQGALACWDEVLSQLQKHNPMLCGTLTDSKAYLEGKYVLIDADNPIFFDMIKSNKSNGESIKKAISDVMGEVHPIGPYKRSRVEKNANDRVAEMLEKAKELGIETQIEG